MQSQQRSREELTSLLAERLARKKALNSAVYVDDATVDAKAKENKIKDLMLSGEFNKLPAALFDEARDEVAAAVHDMWHRYNNNSATADTKTTSTPGNARAGGDDAARDGVEEPTAADDEDPKQDARSWISIAAAKNPNFASLLACGPTPRSNNSSSNNHNPRRPSAAAPTPAAHGRSAPCASHSYEEHLSCASTDSTLSSLQAPDVLDELEWWIPGFDKDKFRTLIDELKQDEDRVEVEEASGDVYNSFSVAEQSLNDMFEGLECESITDQDDDTNEYGNFSVTESATTNTFDSAVGCAPTEEMDNTVVDQDRAADGTGPGSTLAYYEHVVQKPSASDGSSSNGGPSNDAHKTTEITESYAPNDGVFAIECKCEHPSMSPQDTHETAVGAAPEAADDGVNWEKEEEEEEEQQEEGRADPADQDQRGQVEITDANGDEEAVAHPKHSRVPGSLRRFNPTCSSKSVASSISKIKTKLGKMKKSNHTTTAAVEPKGTYLFLELNAR